MQQEMKKRKNNSFSNNFNLLNTQESNEDILWSSSGSSDYENVPKNMVSGRSALCSYKRKRKRKKGEHKNLSNLEIDTVNISEKKKPISTDRSPITGTVSKIDKQFLEHQRVDSSPVLTCKVAANVVKRTVKSPVLLLKCQSTVISPTTKKKLCFHESKDNNKVKGNIPELLTGSSYSNSDHYKNKVIKSKLEYDDNSKAVSMQLNSPRMTSSTEHEVNISDKKSFTNNITPKTKVDLIQRVQSYFDSHFNSDSTSQQSISECDTLTPKSNTKSPDEVEIISPLTQIKNNSPGTDIFFESNSNCQANMSIEKSRKNKYKKDGLAHRLDCLLKKQNSNISLWQHEKYLARNSNFVIPKCEHIVFRIQKVHIKYGCYLIEAVGSRDIRHLIFLNGCYINSNCNLTPNIVLKLYMPYKILDFLNEFKLVVNVCKFEFVPIDM